MTLTKNDLIDMINKCIDIRENKKVVEENTIEEITEDTMLEESNKDNIAVEESTEEEVVEEEAEEVGDFKLNEAVILAVYEWVEDSKDYLAELINNEEPVTEGANIDNIKKYKESVKAAKQSLKQGKKHLKAGEIDEAKKVINDAIEDLKKAKKEILANSNNIKSNLIAGLVYSALEMLPIILSWTVAGKLTNAAFKNATVIGNIALYSDPAEMAKATKFLKASKLFTTLGVVADIKSLIACGKDIVFMVKHPDKAQNNISVRLVRYIDATIKVLAKFNAKIDTVAAIK